MSDQCLKIVFIQTVSTKDLDLRFQF